MPVLPTSVLPNRVNGSIGGAVIANLQGSPGTLDPRENLADFFRYSNRTPGQAIVQFPNAQADWRVRINLAPGSDYFTDNLSLLGPLLTGLPSGNWYAGTGVDKKEGLTRSVVANGVRSFLNSSKMGVIFPYTPTISMTHTATYSTTEITHNNYKQHNYHHSDVGPISITADFTVQNINEGQYLMAAIYFFRACTKMFFGADPNAGNPPPIVYLNGYGQYYLPNVPCVVTSFQHTMPNDCDYMDIPEPAATSTGLRYRLNSTRMPTTSSMVLQLQPVYSRYAQSQGFSLNDFARGALINSAANSIPNSAFGASQGTNYANKGATQTKGPQNGGFL
jgi:hypothetical protein